jgi:hypothetical protein
MNLIPEAGRHCYCRRRCRLRYRLQRNRRHRCHSVAREVEVYPSKAMATVPRSIYPNRRSEA